MHFVIVWMILKHLNTVMFSRQTAAIKTTCLIELGNLKVPLVIFKPGTVAFQKKRKIWLQGSGWQCSVSPLFFELLDLSLS